LLLVDCTEGWTTWHRIQTVKPKPRDGFNTVLRNTRERIKKFKELGKEDVLLRCLSAVAKADGTVHDAEKKVYNMFVAALKDASPTSCARR
jgi:tellurite resistance protein